MTNTNFIWLSEKDRLLAKQWHEERMDRLAKELAEVRDVDCDSVHTLPGIGEPVEIVVSFYYRPLTAKNPKNVTP